jgi:hypothetical protein
LSDAVYNDEMQGPVHMRDKTVVQLLERTVDILMLRAANNADVIESSALTQSRSYQSFDYLHQVAGYFHTIALTNVTDPPRVITAYRLLEQSLNVLANRCHAAPQAQIRHPYFVHTGPPTRRLCRKIEEQLLRIENEQGQNITATRNRLNEMLVLLVRHGLAT